MYASRSGKLEVELNVGFGKVVAGDLANTLQPIAQRISVDIEDSS